MSISAIFVVICALIAVGYSLVAVRWVLLQPTGNERMGLVAAAIQQGASAYLHRQSLVLAIIVLVLMAPLWYWLGSEIAIGFLLGALLASAVGYLGTQVAVRANLRTAEAARRGVDSALQVAFRGGVVSGLLVIGVVLLAVAGYYLALAPDAAADRDAHRRALSGLVGLACGSSLISLFARLAGGVFTKGADLGADSVSRSQSKIQGDDVRNPAVIADQVGDQVGDCAAMAADLFETYLVTLVGSMLLGALLLQTQGSETIAYPLVLGAVAALASVVGPFFVKLETGDTRILAALTKALMVSGVLAFVLFLPVTWLLLPASLVLPGGEQLVSRWGVLGAAGIGLALTGLLLVTTEYYTGTDYPPVRGIAKASKSGLAINLIAGVGVSMKATAAPVMLLCAAIWASHELAGLYGVAIAAVAMLSLSGIILALAASGPISDNAAGIARMAGMEASARDVTEQLDATGNTTKAVAKGYAISSAALAALVLFADFAHSLNAEGRMLTFELGHPEVLIGLFIGALVPYLLSAMAVEAVARVAAKLVEEVRRQFRALPGILDYSQRPDYARAVDRLTKAAIKALIIPALLVVTVPVAVGFGMHWLMGGDAGALALGGMLIGAIITALFLALALTAGGSAWDNAKHSLEQDDVDGQGAFAHQVATLGDALGDPGKDCAGPAMNPLIKLTNLVALLLVPLL